MRINCITEFGLINDVKKIRLNNLLAKKLTIKKTKKLSIQKLNINKQDNNYLDKKRKNIFLMQNTFNKNNNYNFLHDKRHKILSPSPSTRYASSLRRNYNITTNRINDRISSSKIDFKNNNVYQNYNSFINKKTPNSCNNNVKTALEVKKSIFKILPILTNSFNITLDKSRKLKNNLNSFQKEIRNRSENTKKKKQTIIKRCFGYKEVFTLKKSLQTVTKRKKKNKFIVENKNGRINLKFNLIKREKSPLIFVEDYNKLRNRRRKNNRIENNLGLMVNSLNVKKNINRGNFLLGMSLNDIRKKKIL